MDMAIGTGNCGPFTVSHLSPMGNYPFQVGSNMLSRCWMSLGCLRRRKGPVLPKVSLPQPSLYIGRPLRHWGLQPRPVTLILKQLSQAYGTACEGEELYSLFRDTYQKEGERPSQYLLRVEDKLDQAIQFGGVPGTDADRLRLSQFMRGCIHNEGLVSNLQLRQRRGHHPPPPGLVEFLREVCVEETAEEARSQRWRAQGIPKRAQAREIQAEQDDPNPFLKELGKIMAQLQALQMPPAAQPPPAVSTTPPTDMAAIVTRMQKCIEVSMIYVLFQIMPCCPMPFSHWSSAILTCWKNNFRFIFDLGNSWEILHFDI
ncbi:Zinc finger CCHC domain-containing protein 18 [Holothuria leucospilota]|uniref:Zinc finger CCHC domain-containing protein 18 n=1 Tax=Holothuria leucospilota TaxID=206669 RepID=A0A9Q1HC35_HOLLE|nr:Zinc finger CCHC domain-containing protein 18 [Holothuria leucospilota]